VKYYLEFPIPIECGLQCPYCFHSEAWKLQAESREKFLEKYEDVCVFTLDRFKAWRDKHLADASEFLVELSGGEMSHPKCQEYVLNVLDNLGKSSFQLQTNGLGDEDFYNEVVKRKDVIDRIGFTYHRKSIDKTPDPQAAIDKFYKTVYLFKNAGFTVYIKEILFPYLKQSILEHKASAEAQGIEFRIQDFKPIAGRSRTPYYTPEEMALVHPEYCHGGPHCACRPGYKNIIVRGFDYFAGDVIGCWQDPKPIGNVLDDWYDPNYSINKLTTGELKVEAPNLDVNHVQAVTAKPLREAGETALTGDPTPFRQKLITKLDKYRLEFSQIDARITEYKQQIAILTDRGRELIGAINSAEELINELGGD